MKSVVATLLVLAVANATVYEETINHMVEWGPKYDPTKARITRHAAHAGYEGFIKGWFAKSENPITLEKDCLGDWVEEYVPAMLYVKETKIMKLELEPTRKGVDSWLEVVFKNDGYCHFRQVGKTIFDYCFKKGNEGNCQWDVILASAGKYAFSIISNVMKITDAIKTMRETHDQQEFVNNIYEAGLGLGTVLSDVIGFH